MNYYKILGISNNACKKAIREAYLKKVKLYHPDINKSPDALIKFKQVQEAYDALYNSNNYTYDNNKYSSNYKTNNTNKDKTYYTDDFNDFHKAFYEEVRKMREADRKQQNRTYARYNDNFFDYMFHKYPKEYFYINLIFKIFPLFFVPFLFCFIIYKQYLLRSHFREKPIIIYDSYGRAFLIDIKGKKIRASEFDKY